jgi:hypothetical protein
LRIAVVYGAGIGVVAIEHGATHARLFVTHVAGGAGIPIVAAQVVGTMDTPQSGVARIVCAQVLIVTVHRTAPDTLALGTQVKGRAKVTVIARCRVVGKEAPGHRITLVIGAAIGVVADHGDPWDARPWVTGIANSAHGAVIAGQDVVMMHAPQFHVTDVVGAGIIVIATDKGCNHAHSPLAVIPRSTLRTIVTGAGVGHELAPGLGVAGIIGAGVTIVAGETAPSHAIAQMAVVARGTQVTIVTRRAVEAMRTPHVGNTGVIGADVVVVAVDGLSGATGPGSTLLAHRTGIAIVTRTGGGQEEAPL